MWNKKQPQTDRLQVNLPLMIIAVVLFIVVASFLTITFTTQDPTWFISGFIDMPNRVVVYHDGQKTEYVPGKSGFLELAEGARASLNAGVARPSGIGLSKESLEDAYNLYLSVEAFFPKQVKLHTWFNTGNPTQMLFLITGRHSDRAVVFMGDKNVYMAGAPVLNTIQPLVDALNMLGYQTQNIN